MLNQIIKFQFASEDSDLVKKFSSIIKKDPSVDAVTAKIDSQTTTVNVTVIGGTKATLNNNVQYMLGACTYTRKQLEATELESWSD